MLHRVLKVAPNSTSIAEQLLKKRHIMGSRNDEDIAHTRLQQSAQRIIDHWLIIDGHQLFADGDSKRMEASAGSTGEDDAFHGKGFGAM